MKRTNKLEDFVQDPSFQAWVAGDPCATDFWTDWLRQYPDQQVKTQQARAIVQALKFNCGSIRTDEVDREIDQLLSQIGIAKSVRVVVDEPKSPWLWSLNGLRIAASVLVFFGLGAGYYLLRQAEKHEMPAFAGAALAEEPAMTVRVNETDHPMTLVLSDGSVVTLASKSNILYATCFTEPFRKVYLSGEAFFEVAHNTKQPFLLYANGTVTKVVGTSFRVQAAPDSQNVRVAVQTGKVVVYSEANFQRETPQTTCYMHSVVLKPNQQVVFNGVTEALQKSPVETLAAIAVPSHIKEIEVNDVPVTQLLKRLESAYGITITYDAATLAKYPITASFSDETLNEKLTFICNAIGARHEVRYGRIVISQQ